VILKSRFKMDQNLRFLISQRLRRVERVEIRLGSPKSQDLQGRMELEERHAEAQLFKNKKGI